MRDKKIIIIMACFATGIFFISEKSMWVSNVLLKGNILLISKYSSPFSQFDEHIIANQIPVSNMKFQKVTKAKEVQKL